MSEQTYNLLIFQQTRRLPGDLAEFMHAKGFGSQVVTDHPYIPYTAVRLKAPILLIEGGGDASAEIETAQYLLDQSELFEYPLVFLTENPQAFERTLPKKFSICYMLPASADNRLIHETLRRVVEHYRPKFEHVEIAPEDEDFEPVIRTEHAPPTRILETVDDFRAFPDFLFEQLERLQMVENPIGGEELFKNITFEELGERGMLPDDAGVVAILGELIESLPESKREHLCRTSFSSNSIQRAMQFPPGYEEVGKSASMLFAWAMTGAASGLLDRNYIPGKGDVTDRIAEKVRMSATRIQNEMGDERLASTIMNMAELISSGVTPENDLDYALVSSLVAADLANRMCFQNSGWNPRGVHSLMRKIKAGELAMLHPVVLSCLVKFLNEAVAYVQKVTAASEKPHRVKNPDGSVEVKVPVIALQPGMRLAQPLHARDGRVVCDSDIQLDPDLIWRIWQLAAIRVLKSPFVVSKVPPKK